jgi:hypothetical protein
MPDEGDCGDRRTETMGTKRKLVKSARRRDEPFSHREKVAKGRMRVT